MPIHKGTYHKRTIDKIHILVRLELANPLLSQGDVARLAGISPASFGRLKTLPLWKQVHNSYHTGILSNLDTKVERNLQLEKETLQFAVPIALQGLVQQALTAKDERIRNKACNDILDRDGHHAKVTRVGLATGEQGGVGNKKDDETAAALLDALRKGQQPSIDSPAITEVTQ